MQGHHPGLLPLVAFPTNGQHGAHPPGAPRIGEGFDWGQAYFEPLQIYDDIRSGALNSGGRHGGGAMDEFGPLNAIVSKIIPSCKDWPYGPSCPKAKIDKRTALQKQ